MRYKPDDLQQIIHRIDPRLPIRSSATGEQLTALPLFPYRAAVAALGLLGLIASGLLLSGLHAMLAYAVVKRQREIGIRVALGADRRSVIHAVLSRVVRDPRHRPGARCTPVVGHRTDGVIAGARRVAGRAACSSLAIVGLLALIALVSCAGPVRRSLRVDPLVALAGGLMRTLLSRLGELLFRRSREERLSDEIAHHLDLMVEDLKRGGHVAMRMRGSPHASSSAASISYACVIVTKGVCRWSRRCSRIFGSRSAS